METLPRVGVSDLFCEVPCEAFLVQFKKPVPVVLISNFFEKTRTYFNKSTIFIENPYSFCRKPVPTLMIC